MTGANRSNQAGASAGRDIAGRDLITTNNIIQHPMPSPLQALLQRIDEARDTDPVLNGLIAELQHYTEYANDSTPIGLSEKLSNGSRVDLIPQALREKELFTMVLSEYQHSSVAQRIFAYLLGDVRNKFTRHVVPLIEDGAKLNEVDAAIVEHVIEPCIEILRHNPLGISSTHLRGMIYFLTGNCYLKWSRG
jgi:hypothetical protein